MTVHSHSKEFVLKVAQSSPIGLMDGSVSILWAIGGGAAISMGFYEGLSDDGALTGRGHLS